MEEWPSNLETTFSGTPRVSMTLAAECRSVYSPAAGGPALAAAAFRARKAFRGSRGAPNSVLKTKPVSRQAEPAR